MADWRPILPEKEAADHETMPLNGKEKEGEIKVKKATESKAASGGRSRQTKTDIHFNKPTISGVTYSSVSLNWSKPKDTTEKIHQYTITYSLVTQLPKQWISAKELEGATEETTIHGLNHSSSYVFKVTAFFHSGIVATSDVSDEARTPSVPNMAKPVVYGVTESTISLNWSTPKELHVIHFTVFYQSFPTSTEEWEVAGSERGSDIQMNVMDLAPGVEYKFKVYAVCRNGEMIESEASDLCQTKKECRAGKPEILTVRDTSITLRWAAPGYGASDVEYYVIHYCCLTDSEQKWEPFKYLVLAQRERMITITGLQRKTEYVFKVHVVSRGNIACADSYCSNPTSTKAETPAIQLLPKCTLVRKQAPAIYQLPVNIISLDGNEMFRRCEIGTADRVNPAKERVLMLVGATGAGITTLVNAITNYILGVSWEDNFRFQLIGDEGTKSQAHSQTQSVTAYTFHKMECSQLDYTLTIVDTPGFLNTRGLQYDRIIRDQIEHFFSKTGGISFLNGIGFVAQASVYRLTPKQKYLFNTVLGMFGKDVTNSISIMATFADGKMPPLYTLIDEAKVHSDGMYTFNNSSVYEEGEYPFASLFFQMGVENFRNFFHQFEEAEKISLVQTNEVLAERRRLEVTTENLQKQVYEFWCKMEELRQLEQEHEDHNREKDRSKDFTLHVRELKKVRIQNVKSKCVTCKNQSQDLVKQVKQCLEHLSEIALWPSLLNEEKHIDDEIDAQKQEKKPWWKERVKSYESLKQQREMVHKISRGGDVFEK